MQLPRRPSKRNQSRLLFLDPDQTELWTSLSLQQQQTCQELLSQLLQQVLADRHGAEPSEQRRDDP
jgi:hypothetical protein